MTPKQIAIIRYHLRGWKVGRIAKAAETGVAYVSRVLNENGFEPRR